MANYRKLGRASNQRKAMLRALTTSLLEHGKIFTTEARAKEVRKQVEKLIALSVREKDNYEMVAVKAKVAKKDADGKRVKEEGLENDLLERIVKDDAFPLTEEDIQGLMKGELYIGRAKEQVEEFISEYIQPILEENKEELNLSVEIAL